MAHQYIALDFPTAKLPQIGAGEGNRTLVISLEGIGASRDTNAYSDIHKLFDDFETKPLIGAVRTSNVGNDVECCGIVEHERRHHTAPLGPRRHLQGSP
jgi:hypothetical protein